MTKLQILGAVAAVALAACDGQAGPDYPGEPLATIHGTVLANVAVSGPLDVVLAWIPSDDSIDEPEGPAPFFSQRATVSAEFPATFTLEVFEPPPVTSYRYQSVPEYGVPAIAHALIIAGPVGFKIEVPEPRPGLVFGTSHTHQVMYMDRAVVAGTFAASAFGRAISAGYHVTPLCPEDESSDELSPCFLPAPDDLDTEIVLELEPL